MKLLIETKRKKLGLKTYELANAMHIDSSLMSRILNGKRNPTDYQLFQLSQILSIDYDVLIKEKLKRKIVNILSEYPSLAPEVMQVAEERVRYLTSKDKFEVIDTKPIDVKLKKLIVLQKKWVSKKPLDATQLAKMAEYFNTQYTYESNQIEGNTLDFQETHLVVNEGITIGGKSMKEHLEAINHQEAIDYVIDLAKNKINLTEHVLKQLHQIILKGIDKKNAGVYRTAQVRIAGSKHIPPESFQIDGLMADYFLFYSRQKNKLHPVVLAAEMHERLVTIHPFIDGNGRTSRLVMNLILLNHGYPIVSLKGDITNRKRYYSALEAVQVNHIRDDFYHLIVESTMNALEQHLALTN